MTLACMAQLGGLLDMADRNVFEGGEIKMTEQCYYGVRKCKGAVL